MAWQTELRAKVKDTKMLRIVLEQTNIITIEEHFSEHIDRLTTIDIEFSLYSIKNLQVKLSCGPAVYKRYEL